MHITLETDYAIRIVCLLAGEAGRLDAGSISGRTGVSTGFSLKILRKLVGAGLVRSYQGKQGGYELAADPTDINLCQILEAVEGEYVFCRCLSPDGSCSKPNDIVCKAQHVFGEITATVRQMLKKVTVKDLL